MDRYQLKEKDDQKLSSMRSSSDKSTPFDADVCPHFDKGLDSPLILLDESQSVHGVRQGVGSSATPREVHGPLQVNARAASLSALGVSTANHQDQNMKNIIFKPQEYSTLDPTAQTATGQSDLFMSDNEIQVCGRMMDTWRLKGLGSVDVRSPLISDWASEIRKWEVVSEQDLEGRSSLNQDSRREVPKEVTKASKLSGFALSKTTILREKVYGLRDKVYGKRVGMGKEPYSNLLASDPTADIMGFEETGKQCRTLPFGTGDGCILMRDDEPTSPSPSPCSSEDVLRENNDCLEPLSMENPIRLGLRHRALNKLAVMTDDVRMKISWPWQPVLSSRNQEQSKLWDSDGSGDKKSVESPFLPKLNACDITSTSFSHAQEGIQIKPVDVTNAKRPFVPAFSDGNSNFISDDSEVQQWAAYIEKSSPRGSRLANKPWRSSILRNDSGKGSTDALLDLPTTSKRKPKSRLLKGTFRSPLRESKSLATYSLDEDDDDDD